MVQSLSAGRIATAFVKSLPAGRALAALALVLPAGSILAASCDGINGWEKSAIYLKGQTSQQEGVLYQAKWWTQGESPAKSGQWGVWQPLGECQNTEPLANTHTGGRVQTSSAGTVAFSWPGIYFETRIKGSGVAAKFDDALNQYDIYVDGQLHEVLKTPGNSSYQISGLSAGVHDIKIAKRTESAYNGSGHFQGFISNGQGVFQAAPLRSRQIEFIGDSYTVGLGNMSPKRECSQQEITDTTNTNLAFGPLTAKHYNADYQINAYSGLGLVRNYDGAIAEVNFRSFYDRAQLTEAGNVWVNNGSWKPQVVVVGLGLNDFSTPVHSGEAYSQDGLADEFFKAYTQFIAKLRQQYGKDALIVVSHTPLWNTAVFTELTQKIVASTNAAGDSRVVLFSYSGLEANGCQWHPSLKDHQKISDDLILFIDQQTGAWGV